MMTWRLWRALRHPPTLHPLFWRTIYRSNATQFATPNYQINIYSERALLILIGAILITWVLAVNMTGLWGTFFFNLLMLLLSIPFVVVAAIFLRYTLLNSIITGMFWAQRISDTIAHENERGVLKLLWLSPPGALGASVAVCTGCLYRRATIHQFRARFKWLIIATLVLGFLFVPLNGAWTWSTHTHPFLHKLVIVFTLVIAFRIDGIQSIVLGSLVGMLVPTFVHNRFDTRLLAVVVYVILQFVTIVLLLLSLLILPGLYRSLEWTTWYVELSPAPVGLLMFCLAREGMIQLMWRVLARRLNALPSELRFWP